MILDHLDGPNVIIRVLMGGKRGWRIREGEAVIGGEFRMMHLLAGGQEATNMRI